MKKWIAILMATMLIFSSTSAFAATFDDVTDAHAWAKSEIENYAERGILTGDGAGNFKPDDNVTRAEFAKMLCLVFDLKSASEITYADVEKDSWKYDFIAKTDTIVYTENADTYAPDAAATRAEIAYAIVNAMAVEAKADSMPFSDADAVIGAMKTKVRAAYALGLLKGYPDNTFRPQASVTRAEAVVLLTRAEAVLAAQKPEEKPEEPKEPITEDKKESEDATESIKIMPMETLCYIESADRVLHPTEDETCLRLKFYVAGSEKIHTLYAAEDVPVYDIDGSRATLRMGDVICIETTLYGAVKKIHIVMRMGDEPLLDSIVPGESTFAEMYRVMAEANWGYLESGKKHEVYLGLIGDIKYNNDNTYVVIYPSTGETNASEERILALSGDAKITCYTTNARAKKRYTFTTMDAFGYVLPNKDTVGNIVWETEDDVKDAQYIFVKTCKDEITDLIIISNR